MENEQKREGLVLPRPRKHTQWSPKGAGVRVHKGQQDSYSNAEGTRRAGGTWSKASENIQNGGRAGSGAHLEGTDVWLVTEVILRSCFHDVPERLRQRDSA